MSVEISENRFRVLVLPKYLFRAKGKKFFLQGFLLFLLFG